MRTLFSCSFMVFLLLLNTSMAIANEPVTGRIEAFIVSIDDEGNELVEPTDAAEPGDLMEYRLTFVNHGETAVSGLSIVDPIPTNTTFVGQSASADAEAYFEVSIDGGKTFENEPVVRIETQKDGAQKEVVIDPSQYTHIRWAVEDALDGDGGTQEYAYRVVVD